jgi:hypothetical protein
VRAGTDVNQVNPGRARWIWYAWWCFPVAVAALFAAPVAALPGDDLGIRGFATPPLHGGVVYSQSFRMTTDGLHTIEVYPVGVGPRVNGTIRFDLYEVHELGDNRSEAHIHSADVLAGDLISAPSYRFEFPPIPNSKGRTYRFDLAGTPAQGVAFWATHGDRYEGGSLSVNDRGRWADLVFHTYAPVPSLWQRVMALRKTDSARSTVIIAAFPTIWLLAGFTIQVLSAASITAMRRRNS